MLVIDGSHGEGGGQVLRTSLTMSVLTGISVRIENIRAHRSRPGLMKQHLTSVLAASAICNANVVGAELGSLFVEFHPGKVQPGDYRFAVGTAGSATLVLQTVLPALMQADAPSTLVLEGGTHGANAPSFDFIAHSYLPIVNRMGPQIQAELVRYGFYPAGGGQFRITVTPSATLTPVYLLERGEILQIDICAVLSRLPKSIGEREIYMITSRLGWDRGIGRVEEVRNSIGSGNAVIVTIRSTHVTEVFTGFGQRSISAEKVGQTVANEVQEYLEAQVPAGHHLADQLMLLLAQAKGGAFRTISLSQHSQTQLAILTRFLDVRFVKKQINNKVWEIAVV
ncbi:MAG: RNA 3'-terminal phosphate cyclase [Myxococcales bacterium]|nr:RNA 3'-terminal phosphate cyclase [Myxococcales bacterium]